MPGELLVSGYNLQKGYWGDEEQTRRVMVKDDKGALWMHTGDEAIMDEDGYLSSEYSSNPCGCLDEEIAPDGLY